MMRVWVIIRLTLPQNSPTFPKWFLTMFFQIFIFELGWGVLAPKNKTIQIKTNTYTRYQFAGSCINHLYYNH